ncbi:MAG TPA: carboxymuconolactone decarboxylase family protein [Gemmatimonadales bacterium]|nr:carboxymuconolactone decarboxylase family protein [Gemmatimonadales bacterium]
MTAVLDPQTQGLMRVALALPHASENELADWMRRAREEGTPALWLEELLLASVLYVGFPRAIVAWTVYRRLEPDPAPGSEPSDYARWQEWQGRGEAACRAVYGKHYDQLRHNIGTLHPALDQWMIVDGYGKTLSRGGLSLMQRELCSVAMLVPQGVPRQLVSHFTGAINTGATPEQVDEVLNLATALPVRSRNLDVARSLWQELKDSLVHD